MWQHWINLILGIAILIAAYTGASVTFLVIVGILLIVFSLWGAIGGASGNTKRANA